MAAKYPFGRIRSSAAMVGQMLHLRAAVIADACELFMWFGRESGIADEWQINRIAAEQFETLPKISR